MELIIPDMTPQDVYWSKNGSVISSNDDIIAVDDDIGDVEMDVDVISDNFDDEFSTPWPFWLILAWREEARCWT